MLALGVNNNTGPLFLKDIARSEDLSEKYLSQIIIPLKAKGLVNTFRGAHGGYMLSRPASDITLKEIIEPLEGDLGLVDCVKNPEVCGQTGDCVTREVWTEMSSLLSGFLESMTLEDLVRKHKKIKGSGKTKMDYSI